MATLNQLRTQLAKKKEKTAKLTDEIKVLKGEIALVKQEIFAVKATDVKPEPKKKAPVKAAKVVKKDTRKVVKKADEK